MTSLQPNSADIYERVVEQSREERWATLQAAVPAIRTGKRISPAPDVLPFVIFEDGLGMLTPFVANVYDLLDGRGRDWMGKRGLYEAVTRGLAFLGLEGIVEPADHRRFWWNSSQIRFGSMPANDAPLLSQIEGIVRLSLPYRSDFRRGVHKYDVPPAEGDGTVLDGCHLEDESGIRLAAGGTTWSFGRTTEFDHLLTEAEGIALGNWIEIPAEGGIPWASMTYPWITATFKWAENPDALRRSLMAAWFVNREVFLALKDEGGDVIGYRRTRACRPVSQAVGGSYTVGSQPYAPHEGGQRIYIEAMTDFGDAVDVTASSIALVVNANRAAGVPAGRLWLGPDDLTGGQAFAEKTVSIPMRKTVRDRIKFIVRF